MVHEGAQKRVPLRAVSSGRIVRTHDGRYGVTGGRSPGEHYTLKRVDFWPEGWEMRDADELVDVLPEARLR